MLHTLTTLIGLPVLGADGVFGTVRDAFFDERDWRIRYLLIEVSRAGRSREVLFPPEAIVSIDAKDGLRVEGLPPLDRRPKRLTRSLRSMCAVLDCRVIGRVGDMGRVGDVVFDADLWVLRFLMIDASYWSSGAVFFVHPGLVREANWERQSLYIAATRVEVLRTPDAEQVEIAAAAAEQAVLH